MRFESEHDYEMLEKRLHAVSKQVRNSYTLCQFCTFLNNLSSLLSSLICLTLDRRGNCTFGRSCET